MKQPSKDFERSVARGMARTNDRSTYHIRFAARHAAAGLDPEVAKMSPRYMRYLLNKKQHGFATFAEFKAANPES